MGWLIPITLLAYLIYQIIKGLNGGVPFEDNGLFFDDND